MSHLIGLYGEAEARGIPVYWFELSRAESLSYRDEEGVCYIAMDPWRLPTAAHETVKLAHEMGHCATGSFYNRWSACDVRQKHENRANAGPIGVSFRRRRWRRPSAGASGSPGSWPSTSM